MSSGLPTPHEIRDLWFEETLSQLHGPPASSLQHSEQTQPSASFAAGSRAARSRAARLSSGSAQVCGRQAASDARRPQGKGSPEEAELAARTPPADAVMVDPEAAKQVKGQAHSENSKKRKAAGPATAASELLTAAAAHGTFVEHYFTLGLRCQPAGQPSAPVAAGSQAAARVQFSPADSVVSQPVTSGNPEGRSNTAAPKEAELAGRAHELTMEAPPLGPPAAPRELRSADPRCAPYCSSTYLAMLTTAPRSYSAQ